MHNSIFYNKLTQKRVNRLTARLIIFFITLISLIPISLHASETYRQLNLFGDVFERVKSEYVDKVSDKKLIEAAINGMLTSLDPHSSFLDKKSFGEMRVQTKGEFGGIGIEVTMENGLVKVVSPIDDTPGSRAGLEPGDLITHLDGVSILGLSLRQAVGKMRGPVDEEIILSIRRKNVDPFKVKIRRAIIKIRSVRFETIDDIGYIRITTFNQQTTPGLKKAISELKKRIGASLSGFILDLRNNPGGLLNQAISVSDIFLNQGEIVSTRGRDPENTSRVHAKAGDLTEGAKLIVLINTGSASASEIVAGALQDHKRAIILGTQSFGKGSVQTIVPLSKDIAMRLTTARYYTPSGKSIQKTGISPDIVVSTAKIKKNMTNNQRREADLRGALENTDKEKQNAEADTSKSRRPTAKELANTDYQLARAVDLLRGLSLLEKRILN
ncbi:S41 family peptidase [Rhodospirillaceae bacterium]|nr:S41 family peptidase [Rhodospirillaceae bacterium]